MSRIKHNLPTIVITGRTNVGKSTLFNLLTEKKQAIVSDIAGTTRDLNTGVCTWQGQNLMVVDTAGLDVNEKEKVDQESLKRAEKSFKKADLIVLLTDGRDGILPQDKTFAEAIKKTKKPMLLVVNKIDGPRQQGLVAEFHKLNVGEPVPVSAKNGVGTGDFLDKVVEIFKKDHKLTEEDDDVPKGTIKVAILGKPNVGKSSLFNAIAGEDRAIVSEVPHTTRDTQDVLIEYTHEKLPTEKAHFLFIDTAGIRRKSKIKQQIERLSVSKALSAIKRADVVLMMIDISEKISHQDLALIEQILEQRKSVILVANKWDLIKEKTTESDKKYRKYIANQIRFLKWAPVVFISASSTFNVTKLLNLVYETWKIRHKSVTDRGLDRLLKKIVKIKKPVTHSGPDRPRIQKIVQDSINPPTFSVHLSKGYGLHFSYLRFIENQIREQYGFEGTPMVLSVQKAVRKKHVNTEK